MLLQQLVYRLLDGNDGWIMVHYDVVINGVVYPWEDTQIGTYGPAFEGSCRVEDYFRENPHPLIEVVVVDEMISGRWPISWKAKTSADVRVELRPRYETAPNMEEYSNPAHFDNNPTFHIDENGVIYFCIKGLNEVPEDPPVDPDQPPVLSQVWMEKGLGALVNGAPQIPADHTLSVQAGESSVVFDLPSTNGWLDWHVYDLGFTDIVEYTGTDDWLRLGWYSNDGSTGGPIVPTTPLGTVNDIEIYAVPTIDRDGNVWLRLLFRNTLSEQVNVRWSTSYTAADTFDFVYRHQSRWTRARVINSGECDIQLAAAPTDFGTGLLLKQGEGYGNNVDWSLLDNIQPSGAYALRYILNGVDQQAMVQMDDSTGQSIIIALWNSIETSRSLDSDDAGSFQLSINLSGGEDGIPFVNFAPVQSLNRLGVIPSLYDLDPEQENNIAVDLHFLPRLDADYQGIPSGEITDVFPWLFGEMSQSPVIHAPVCLLRQPL